MKKTLIMVTAMALGLASAADYLYWQVNSGLYTGSSYSYAQLYSVSGENYTAVSGYYDVESGFINESSISSDTTLSYCIKLGNLTGSGWEEVAMSSVATYTALEQYRSATQLSASDMMSFSAWTGGAYTAPEPSSALLLLFGLAGLGLKRKNA